MTWSLISEDHSQTGTGEMSKHDIFGQLRYVRIDCKGTSDDLSFAMRYWSCDRSTFVDCKRFGSCRSNSIKLRRGYHEAACRKPLTPNEQGVFAIVLRFLTVMNRAATEAAATSPSRRAPQGVFFVLPLSQVNSKQEHQATATLQIPGRQDSSTLTPRHL
jgi:hypothetical protein